jgi:RimJ/RimL family protein N-acetyltransferase
LSTNNFRTHSDFWYAIKYDGEIVATLHIAIRDDMAEFGFTTSPEHRNQGLGQMLFARGFQLVTEFSITRIYLFMLSSNRAMRHIAKKFGMAIVVDGSDAESSLEIQYPVPLSRMQEVKYYMWDKK